MGFHVTNFIIHLICTVLVYFTAKNIFKLSPVLSLIAMLIFGIAASHESNILWAAGRTDSLATIFILAALLSEQQFRQRKKIIWKISALLFFLLGMLSKEIGIFFIPLIIVLFDFQSKEKFSANAKRAFFAILPYCILLAIIILYRSQFITSLPSQSDVIGIHSIKNVAMNVIYTIGYIILPIDFGSTNVLL